MTLQKEREKESITVSILRTSLGCPRNDPWGNLEILELLLTDGRRLVLQRNGYHCVNFSEDEVQEGKAPGSWGKRAFCAQSLAFLLFQKALEKYNYHNTTTSILWLTGSVPTVFPWIPLLFPPFITFLHTASHVGACPTACT